MMYAHGIDIYICTYIHTEKERKKKKKKKRENLTEGRKPKILHFSPYDNCLSFVC